MVGGSSGSQSIAWWSSDSVTAGQHQRDAHEDAGRAHQSFPASCCRGRFTPAKAVKDKLNG
jgi:hypothetical protein